MAYRNEQRTVRERVLRKMKVGIRKLVAMGLSVLLAGAVLVPAPAFAANSPSVQSGEGEEPASGANVTQLTLVLQDPDANLASNGGSAWVAERAKVQVPVAINFVVASDGTISGPGSAAITNYSKYAVNVSNIKVTPAGNVSIASTSGAATSADQVYLEFKPSGNGTSVVDLSQFTGTNGAPPTAGEWNIGAATANGGTSLNLTAFSGKVGGFSAINPLSQAAFGTIEWSIRAGTAQQTGLRAKRVSDLAAAGTAIRQGTATQEMLDEYQGLIGDTVDVRLANNKAATARLVDVNTDKGLVFMFTAPITTAAIDTEPSVNWTTCDLRGSMNSGQIFETYFDGMTIRGDVVTPVTVENITGYISDFQDGQGFIYGVITSNDTYWIPSSMECQGDSNRPEPNNDATRFAYFDRLRGNGQSLPEGLVGCWVRTGGCDASITVDRVADYDAAHVAQLGRWFEVGAQSQKACAYLINTAPEGDPPVWQVVEKGVIPCFAL